MKIALGVEYNGTEFHGWQSQQTVRTIQTVLEGALSRIANEPVEVFCAGRTDAGVHAINQVVHFTTNSFRDLKAWTHGVNTLLPPSISVGWAQEVDEDFHARFSAIARRYRYIILNQSLRSALWAKKATWYRYPLDINAMQFAGNHLIGEHDFSSFRSSQCESTSPMRHLQEISITRQGNLIMIEVQANAFLHHMVRNIVGVLMMIGSGKKEPDWILEVLEVKDRRSASITAPADGLYLQKVFYPSRYVFPENLLF